MESDLRYEILDTIATGEFATVSRARDRDLGREVAVKQIHAQYLADPRQLARYWHEAQLLASLQHPNILTIYDVVRPRGWLILELMKSSLKPAAEGDPMDLDRLRTILFNCLTGLDFLHGNGVIHGDIKPSNILIAPPNRIKLGDFGLARRASNEEGSLLKGTTKYMAPELLSAQFGAVGPASDLYSLGFTAYELMVGSQFDSLLPTLSTFGRDRQLAWMMWHSTGDVKLPDIQRVLEGVPDDLARVIQRLIAKDQSKRYHTAREALHDLQVGGAAAALSAASDPDAEAELAAAARRRKRVRNLSILVAGVGVILCALIGFLWLGKTKPKGRSAPTTIAIHGTISDVIAMSREIGVAPTEQVEGTVASVNPALKEIEIAPADGGAVQRITLKQQDAVLVDGQPRTLGELKPGDAVSISRSIPAKRITVGERDTIRVNGKRHLFEELEAGDVVDITKTIDPKTREVTHEILATRPGSFATGRLMAKDENLRIVNLATDSEANPENLKIFVPAEIKILLNGKPVFQGRPVTLATLAAGDRLKVAYDYQEGAGNKANKLEALRQVELQGTLAEDFDGRLLSVIDSNRQVVKLPFGSQYVITVNGQPLAKPAGLKRGDRVAVKHDTYIAEVVAQRTLGAGGVVQQIRYEAPQSLTVTEDGGQKMTYSVAPNCKITLGGEPAPLDALRANDRVLVEHGAIDPKSQTMIAATAIAAERTTDASRWAMLIAVQNYDDKQISPLAYPLADAALLADTVGKRYRIPADQIRVFNDPSAVTLDREVPDFLKRVGPDARLVVYYVGHACTDAKGQVYLAPKDFHAGQPEVNGRPLQWLVDLMEECPAKVKVLLLDACHAGAGNEQATEPSSAEMIGTLKPQPNRALLRTVTAVASCGKGQRGLATPDKGHGLFAWCLAEGLGGAADANRDTVVEPTELFAYLQKEVATAAKGSQRPEIFLPDDRPPRLSEAAKMSIRRLAGFAGQVKIDGDQVDQEYGAAVAAAGAEPEPSLIYGLLLVKRKAREKAMQHFEIIKSQQPSLLMPYAALAWLRMEKRSYTAAINELAAMVKKIARPAGAGGTHSPEARYLFNWSGKLREHASGMGDTTLQFRDALAALDAAVAAHGLEALELYQKGRQSSAAVLADFDGKIAESTDDALTGKLKIDRKQLGKCADFPVEKYVQSILQQLEQ